MQEELEQSENTITGLKEELGGLQERLEEKTKVVEQVKKVSAKAGKVLDLALKEISSCVSLFSLLMGVD